LIVEFSGQLLVVGLDLKLNKFELFKEESALLAALKHENVILDFLVHEPP